MWDTTQNVWNVAILNWGLINFSRHTGITYAHTLITSLHRKHRTTSDNGIGKNSKNQILFLLYFVFDNAEEYSGKKDEGKPPLDKKLSIQHKVLYLTMMYIVIIASTDEFWSPRYPESNTVVCFLLPLHVQELKYCINIFSVLLCISHNNLLV